MPFKPGKSFENVNNALNRKISKDIPNNIGNGLFKVYQTLSATADKYVPIDTTDMIKSKRFQIIKSGQYSYTMTYGYYTEYAKYLHNSFDWSPRPVGAPGKRGNQWNPNAKPEWLNLAWKESGQKAMKLFEGAL